MPSWPSTASLLATWIALPTSTSRMTMSWPRGFAAGCGLLESAPARARTSDGLRPGALFLRYSSRLCTIISFAKSMLCKAHLNRLLVRWSVLWKATAASGPSGPSAFRYSPIRTCSKRVVAFSTRP